MDIQKLNQAKRNYKLKILVSLMYTIGLFTIITYTFTMTPLRHIAYLDSGSFEDMFLCQISSFVSYMIIIVFFFINLFSIMRQRKAIDFYQIKSANENDVRVKGLIEPRYCGIWNPFC